MVQNYIKIQKDLEYLKYNVLKDYALTVSLDINDSSYDIENYLPCKKYGYFGIYEAHGTRRDLIRVISCIKELLKSQNIVKFGKRNQNYLTIEIEQFYCMIKTPNSMQNLNQILYELETLYNHAELKPAKLAQNLRN